MRPSHAPQRSAQAAANASTFGPTRRYRSRASCGASVSALEDVELGGAEVELVRERCIRAGATGFGRRSAVRRTGRRPPAGNGFGAAAAGRLASARQGGRGWLLSWFRTVVAPRASAAAGVRSRQISRRASQASTVLAISALSSSISRPSQTLSAASGLEAAIPYRPCYRRSGMHVLWPRSDR
jgi:hypothetical protein